MDSPPSVAETTYSVPAGIVTPAAERIEAIVALFAVETPVATKSTPFTLSVTSTVKGL